jgi:hypothetical protein
MNILPLKKILSNALYREGVFFKKKAQKLDRRWQKGPISAKNDEIFSRNDTEK